MSSPALCLATPNFPAVVERHWSVSLPDCSLCHQPGLSESRATAVRPFALSLKSRGAVANAEESLSTALDALAAEKKDSDGDGLPDFDELKKGFDPNTPNGADGTPLSGDSVGPPEYGCSARVARRYDTVGGYSRWLWVGVVGAAALRRRRFSARGSKAPPAHKGGDHAARGSRVRR